MLSIVEVFLEVSVQCPLECIGVGRIGQQVEAHALTQLRDQTYHYNIVLEQLSSIIGQIIE